MMWMRKRRVIDRFVNFFVDEKSWDYTWNCAVRARSLTGTHMAYRPPNHLSIAILSTCLVCALAMAWVHRETGPPWRPMLPDTEVVGSVIETDSLPFTVPDSLIRPLRELHDNTFQENLDGIVARNRKWSRLVASGKMSIGVVDLRDPMNARFADVNGEHMMYAASLPKIAILLAAMDAIEKGELRRSPDITSDMKLMISRSDNAASTRMMDRLGYEKIAAVLQDPRYELYDPVHGGGLWVGKRYAKSGVRRPDPLAGISHGATATQVARYYYLLAHGKLVSRERSEEMLEILTDPALHHKFVNTLDNIAPRARLFRKSGSWRTYHSDSVLVWGPEWRRYILVALIDDEDGERILRQLVLEVDALLRPVPPSGI